MISTLIKGYVNETEYFSKKLINNNIEQRIIIILA
jgi:hypothetical protein